MPGGDNSTSFSRELIITASKQNSAHQRDNAKCCRNKIVQPANIPEWYPWSYFNGSLYVPVKMQHSLVIDRKNTPEFIEKKLTRVKCQLMLWVVEYTIVLRNLFHAKNFFKEHHLLEEPIRNESVESPDAKHKVWDAWVYVKLNNIRHDHTIKIVLWYIIMYL